MYVCVYVCTGGCNLLPSAGQWFEAVCCVCMYVWEDPKPQSLAWLDQGVKTRLDHIWVYGMATGMEQTDSNNGNGCFHKMKSDKSVDDFLHGRGHLCCVPKKMFFYVNAIKMQHIFPKIYKSISVNATTVRVIFKELFIFRNMFF